MNALDRAIEVAGGVTALAYLIGVTQPSVSNWKSRGVPPIRARDIEVATRGAVTRHDLRPDLFDPPPRRKKRAG